MMKEDENNLTPEAIERQTERWSDELSLEEHSLIQGLYASSQAYSQENERSLERIWSRFVQSQERPVLLQEKQPKQAEDTQLFIVGKAIQENEIYRETPFSILTSQPVKRPRRSLWRPLSIGVAVAVVLITILSWAVLSYELRDRPHHSTANDTHTTQAGATQRPGATQQPVISGTLLCSFSADNSGVRTPQQPTLDWSSDGQVAMTYDKLKTFSGQNCVQKSFSSLTPTQATWSPDGKRLLIRDGADKAEVLDVNTGRIIKSFDAFVDFAFFGQSVWSPSGKQIVSVVAGVNPRTASKSLYNASIQIWDASNGALIRTALTFGSDKRLLSFDVGLSPGGKYVAVINSQNVIEVWDINSGKLSSTIPFGHSDISTLAWSPNSASLALGLPHANEMQIWSIASRHMSASFKDSDASSKLIGALAWSPNGKYLAESASDIHIWDINAQKIVATFGGVDKDHFIATLAWSLDGSMLASATTHIVATGEQNTVYVWKLS